jgi:hypothetical protein
MKFRIDDIDFEIHDDRVESSMDEHFIGCARAHAVYYATRDTLYCMILAYHKAGGEVKGTHFFKAIRAVLSRIDDMR